MLEKQIVRKRIKALIKELTEQEKSLLSQQISAKLEQNERFVNAQTVMLFASLPDEVDTSILLQKYKNKKNILLPVVKGDKLLLRHFQDFNHMQKGAFGIQEPVCLGNAFTDLKKIDLVITPGVAFDQSLHRLGRGKGFYDRFFSQSAMNDTYKIGICFPCQLVTELPTETHDILMNEVVSSY